MDQAVDKFWRWLLKNDVLIRRVLGEGSPEKQAELKEHFDRKILELGKFTWEITPGEMKTYALIISPNRNADSLQKTRDIVRVAPNMPHWEWHYAKPANTLLEPLKIYDNNLDPLFVYPENWKIELEKEQVFVQADELKSLDPETQEYVLDLVVSSFFGEAFRIEKIKRIVYS